jgi:hypothetical protein
MATPPPDPADRITELLHRELRTARSTAMDEGTSPEEITADLTERVRRLRRLNDAGWRPGGAAPEGEPQDGATGEARDTGNGASGP